MRIQIPKDVQNILQTLNDAGHSAYIVGGCVRDAVMGKIPHDYDICTSALPEEMKTIFQGRNVIETGLKHGTLTVGGEEDYYEVTTYRVDGIYRDHRHPESITFVDNIEEDLARRDFTVNAMAYHEKMGLVDPFGGKQDIENGIIRCVGDADQRLTEDALRIMRAIRFSAVCGFSVDKETEKAMFRHKELLKKVSEERKTTEFCKMLVKADAALLLRYREIFAEFLPEIRESFDFDQKNYHHRYDVYSHIVHAVAEAPHDLVIRLALFFHDIGKPSVFTEDENGIGHFYGHAKLSRTMTETILKRMKMDTHTIREVCELVEAHDLVAHDSLKYARKLLHQFGEKQLFRLLILARCDKNAQADYEGKEESYRKLAALEQNIREILAAEQCFSLKDLAINGNDLKKIGIREGRLIGEILNTLLECVMEEPAKNTKEQLLEIVNMRWK